MDQQKNRFFDDETGGPVQLELRREGAQFRMLRKIRYHDPEHDEPFVVPDDLGTFRTDLASIPWFFAWLVPGLGSHLPAVLVHDALVVKPGEGRTHKGPDVDREEADRILRDGMASLGTPVVRRWLMWTAVMLATAASDLRPRWYWLPLVGLTLGGVAATGVVATLDLADVWDVLPWMGRRGWLTELVLGLVFAVVIPLAVSVLWGKRWRVAAIAGVTLAALLHVTAAVMAVYGLYWLLEKVVSGPVEGTGPKVTDNLEQISTRPGAPPGSE